MNQHGEAELFLIECWELIDATKTGARTAHAKAHGHDHTIDLEDAANGTAPHLAQWASEADVEVTEDLVDPPIIWR